MKTLTTFALIAGLTLSATALAEPFNSRGPDWTRTVTGSPASPYNAAVAETGYNGRGVDWTSRIPTNSPPRPQETYVVSSGFNEHNHVAFDYPVSTYGSDYGRNADGRVVSGW